MNQYNDKGLKEGYWEFYYLNGNLMYKGVYINGLKDGYWEFYYLNGNLMYKGYFINGKFSGYREEYNGGNIIEKQFYL
jgi:antitoxin component YwqK of YwqJK toxin-antitoxin module